MEEILLFNKFFRIADTCLSCEDTDRQICAIVRRWRIFASFLGPVFSRKQCKIGGKLVLITNRKSCMNFRLVLKSVTLNDLERRNGPYSALFHRIW